MARERNQLSRDTFGRPIAPSPVPADPQVILDFMDDALDYAAKGEATGAPAFDHGTRLFNQLNAHYQLHVARDLGDAHRGLERATRALQVATWWLAGITVALGLVEIVPLLKGH